MSWPCLLYAAYAAEEEDYGQIVGGMDDYAVPLMDLFFFIYDKAAGGLCHPGRREQKADRRSL